MSHIVTVRAVDHYSPEIAAGIGLLMPDLSSARGPQPVSRQHLEAQVQSPLHDQLIAEQAGRIVGAAAISLVLGALEDNTKVQLEDFVVSSDESVRGMGVGFALWSSVVDWAQERGARKLSFTSHSSRVAAHAFYLRQGAVTRDTTSFEYVIQRV